VTRERVADRFPANETRSKQKNLLDKSSRNLDLLVEQQNQALQQKTILIGDLQNKLESVSQQSNQLQKQLNAQCSFNAGVTQQNRLRALKESGFDPKAILDVGANMGDWTKEMKSIFPDARFFMLEANVQHKSSLEKIGSPFRIAAVGHVDGEEVVFYKTAVPEIRGSNTGAGIFKELNKHFEGENLVEERVIMRTIDSLVEESGESGPFHLVKVDVQGAEIVALQGAQKVLQNAAFVLLELSVCFFCGIFVLDVAFRNRSIPPHSDRFSPS
jgi:FkbM family methyltransferase